MKEPSKSFFRGGVDTAIAVVSVSGLLLINNIHHQFISAATLLNEAAGSYLDRGYSLIATGLLRAVDTMLHQMVLINIASGLTLAVGVVACVSAIVNFEKTIDQITGK